ncbi:hypothetical protein TrVE_jg8095 [Triparma verrucosa]|uniref:Uncharacterized protein n=1 Tax=Triparma verrucosa TaxID=1606542 RepID=A0A9W7CDJ6_9STRA|nr:hypothetical protein TrVE_jg8095 [Triparma verrucosa]
MSSFSIRPATASSPEVLSHSFTTRSPTVHKYKSHISWINGIAHTPSDAMATAQTMATYFNRPVNYIHNPTAMSKPSDAIGYVKDLTQATTQLFGRITAEVNDLVEHLRSLCSQTGDHGKVLHLCHSQGVLITYLAAQKLDPSEQRKIEIIAFGGAAAITTTEFPNFARCVNYYSLNDPLLQIVPPASRALSTGLLSFSAATGEPEFVFLTPRGNDPIVDHGLLGPTYKDLVCLEGRRYIDKYETVTYKAYDLATSAQARMDHLCRLIIESTIIKLILLLRALVVKAREILSRTALRIGSLHDSKRTATIQEAIG